jgi:hypothetical protein
MIYLTEDEIVDNIISTMMMISSTGQSDIDYLKTLERKQMGMFHHGVGTNIRNEYQLWDENNPLTKPWFVARANGETEFMVDGVDCHPCHPDAVSMNILYKIWDRTNDQNSTPGQS